MSIKVEINGNMGKDPYVETIGGVEVTVVSVACRRGSSRHADWVQGTIWDKRLGDFVRSSFHKGDRIQAFGVVGRLSVYYSSDSKPHPVIDMFINAIGTAHPEKGDKCQNQ